MRRGAAFRRLIFQAPSTSQGQRVVAHELHLVADIRIASADTRFGQDEDTHGRLPGGGATRTFWRAGSERRKAEGRSTRENRHESKADRSQAALTGWAK